MSLNKVWSVDVFLSEDSRMTRADAHLRIGDREFWGEGVAWRHPADPGTFGIGDELATTRALTDLSHKLLRDATAGIEEYDGRAPAVEG